MKTMFRYSLLLLALLACKQRPSDVPSPELDGYIRIDLLQFERNEMALGSLEERNFSNSIQCNGRIDVPPNNKAVISAVMGGYIVETPLLEGDRVRQGDFLVSLENPEYLRIQQEYLEIQSQLNYLKDDYERQKQLLEEEVSSRKKFLKAESDYRSAQASSKGLEQQLRMISIDPAVVRQERILPASTIRSPITGTITRVHVARGVFVEDSDPIMEIVDSEHIHLELAVLERDVNQISEGQSIEFSIPEVADSTFLGTVKLVGAAVDPVSRTVLVHGHLDDEGTHSFVPGMYVQANILTDDARHWSLPESAVVQRGSQYLGLKIVRREGDVLVLEIVELPVLTRDRGYWILENSESLDPNDQFLVEGVFMLMGE